MLPHSPPRCPLWVKSGHRRTSNQCPLYPQKRTLETTLRYVCSKELPATWRYSPRSAAPGQYLAPCCLQSFMEKCHHSQHEPSPSNLRGFIFPCFATFCMDPSYRSEAYVGQLIYNHGSLDRARLLMCRQRWMPTSLSVELTRAVGSGGLSRVGRPGFADHFSCGLYVAGSI